MDRLSATASATDAGALEGLFGTTDVLPLWIAEPYVPLSPAITTALQERASSGWFGYENRSPDALAAFHDWTRQRHGWDSTELATIVSPSVGTTIGALIDQLTGPNDQVIIQPPVFTDFKPLIRAAGRRIRRCPLVLDDGTYRMDFDALEEAASDETVTLMILCNPHNPVGRAWTRQDLDAVAQICRQHGVAVIADEIHADVVLPGHEFSPFAPSATGMRWAAAHGPLKTFGLAGVCDTLLLTDDDVVADRFETLSNQLHLTRNNVFGLAAFEAAYTHGGPWLDDLLDLLARNVADLQDLLPDDVRILPPEATYLGWLDLRPLDLDVPELARWLAHSARLALSPGHWFGREGAGFARMTIAVTPDVIADAAQRLAIAAR